MKHDAEISFADLFDQEEANTTEQTKRDELARLQNIADYDRELREMLSRLVGNPYSDEWESYDVIDVFNAVITHGIPISDHVFGQICERFEDVKRIQWEMRVKGSRHNIFTKGILPGSGKTMLLGSLMRQDFPNGFVGSHAIPEFTVDFAKLDESFIFWARKRQVVEESSEESEDPSPQRAMGFMPHQCGNCKGEMSFFYIMSPPQEDDDQLPDGCCVENPGKTVCPECKDILKEQGWTINGHGM